MCVHNICAIKIRKSMVINDFGKAALSLPTTELGIVIGAEIGIEIGIGIGNAKAFPYK